MSASTVLPRVLTRLSIRSLRAGGACRTNRVTFSRAGVRNFSSASPSTGDCQSSKTVFRPRRAVLYVPASDERKWRKAASLGADTIVLDFEDGVAENKKEAARLNIQEAMACVDQRSECVVRINDVDRDMLNQDLQAVFPARLQDTGRGGDARPDAIMLPKCEGIEHLQLVDFAVGFYCDKGRPLPLFVMIESPRALLHLGEMLKFAVSQLRNIAVQATVFGSDDFIAAMGGRRTESAEEVLFARQKFVAESRAYGLQAIDMVAIDYKNLDSLRLQSQQGAQFGFTGKQIVHPGQVAIVQEMFSPSQEQIDWATKLIGAFRSHQESGQGVFTFEGKAIDRPLLLQAENIVSLKDMIQRR